MLQQQSAPKIILSADSTCDLDSELKERYHVNYFPLHIILNGKDYKDNVDITPEQVYQEYYNSRTLPKTPQSMCRNTSITSARGWRTDTR